jgi:hypothetical protein
VTSPVIPASFVLQERRWILSNRKSMNGERLGSLIRTVSQKELTRVVEEVLAAIDQIHSVSYLPEVPVYFTNERRFASG